MLLPECSSVCIPREVPAVPSELSLRFPPVQLLLGQRAHVLKIFTLGAPVPSECNMLREYSLLSLDHRCEADTLSCLRRLRKRPGWGRELGSTLQPS